MRFVAFVAVLLTAGTAVAADGDLRQRVERLSQPGGQVVAGEALVAPKAVAALYARRGFVRLWDDASNRAALLGAIRASATDGLRPADYHQAMLRQLASAPPRAEGDILMTDALMALLRQLRQGKVDPVAHDPDWHIDRAMLGDDLIELADRALGSGDAASLIDRARLHHPFYRALRQALQSYRFLARSGGWPKVPEGPALKPGVHDPRVTALRRRLDREPGHRAGAAADDPARYDDALVAAVRRFQERHGLEVDGIVGRNTLAALNVSVEDRIAQIRVNLERARWVLPRLADDMVLVNIAAGYVWLLHGADRMWQSRVIVGQPFHQTPVFRAAMRYLVFNPTWNVPPSIARKELYPKIRRNPKYLAEHAMDLIDGQGHRVDPAKVNFHGRLSYRIVQRAGDDNALGRIKFMLPNRFDVYLHDTPARNLFDRAKRTFSHGCVRVQNPFELAEAILRREPDWDAAKFAAWRASSETKIVNLSKPLPVVILYWTVDIGPGRSVNFYRDIYNRDPAILRALDAPYTPKPS